MPRPCPASANVGRISASRVNKRSNVTVKIKLGSAIIATSEDIGPNNLTAMQSAFRKLKAEFPGVQDEALAREVFINGQITDDDHVIVNSARVIFGGVEGN